MHPLPQLFARFEFRPAFVLLYDEGGIVRAVPRGELIKLELVEEQVSEATVRRGWRVWTTEKPACWGGP